jgi:hypothetical protein
MFLLNPTKSVRDKLRQSIYILGRGIRCCLWAAALGGSPAIALAQRPSNPFDDEIAYRVRFVIMTDSMRMNHHATTTFRDSSEHGTHVRGMLIGAVVGGAAGYGAGYRLALLFNSMYCEGDCKARPTRGIRETTTWFTIIGVGVGALIGRRF